MHSLHDALDRLKDKDTGFWQIFLVSQNTERTPNLELDWLTRPLVAQVVVEEEVFVPQERVLPPTYSGPQIVSKDATLTPLPPSASWGAATGFAPYAAPVRATPYVPPAQVELVQVCPCAPCKHNCCLCCVWRHVPDSNICLSISVVFMIVHLHQLIFCQHA